MKRDRKGDLLEALERNLGVITPACREVGISRETYYRWLREDDDFRNKAEDVNNIAIDYVEHQLYKKIKEGSERSIIFYMKHKGSKRGYTTSSLNEITHNTLPLFPDINIEDNDDVNDDGEDEDGD